MRTLLSRPARLAAAVIAVAATALRASDHQDTPEVELSPRMDINDVYAFPGGGDDRIALVMTTSSPITPGNSATASFDPNLLYQIKVDNTGDAVEDLVLQVTFEGTGAAQRVHVRGPVKPSETGVRSTLVASGEETVGATNAVVGASPGIQVFAGLRDDPFFLDLEQFFRIIPDRRPVSGELSRLPDQPSAGAFRNPGIDYLRGLNTLAIVIELPKARLTAGGGTRLGVWGTISR